MIHTLNPMQPEPTPRERRLKLLEELEKLVESEPPFRPSRDSATLIREDRER